MNKQLRSKYWSHGGGQAGVFVDYDVCRRHWFVLRVVIYWPAPCCEASALATAPHVTCIFMTNKIRCGIWHISLYHITPNMFRFVSHEAQWMWRLDFPLKNSFDLQCFLYFCDCVSFPWRTAAGFFFSPFTVLYISHIPYFIEVLPNPQGFKGHVWSPGAFCADDLKIILRIDL